MPENKPKYQKLKTSEPTMVKCQNGTIAVEGTRTKRVADGRVFQDVRLVSGYTSRYGGFSVGRFNSICVLPKGMTKEDWKKLMDGYNEQQSNLEQPPQE